MATDRVLTLSFHQHEPGFYPTSGSLDDVGIDKGKYYAVNVPLKEGITDDKYITLFRKYLQIETAADERDSPASVFLTIFIYSCVV